MLITLSRQYGAGGASVAERVAEALGWTLVDNAFIDQVSARAGLSREEVARLEERAPSFIERLARSTAIAFPELFVQPPQPAAEFDETKLVKITRNLVADLASEGRMVLVGRAAAAVLAEAEDTLHARLVAPKPFRIRNAVERLGIDPARAAQILEDRDRNRERYHQQFYERDWNDPVNYHLVLNTGRLGFDAAAHLIVTQARALGW